MPVYLSFDMSYANLSNRQTANSKTTSQKSVNFVNIHAPDATRVEFTTPNLSSFNLKMALTRIFGADRISWSQVDYIKDSGPEIITWAIPVIFLSMLAKIYNDILVSKLNFQFV